VAQDSLRQEETFCVRRKKQIILPYIYFLLFFGSFWFFLVLFGSFWFFLVLFGSFFPFLLRPSLCSSDSVFAALYT